MPKFKGPPPALERAIVKTILRWLNMRPGWRAKKLHGNAYNAGWPDILAIREGQAYLLEVKLPKPYGTPVTPRQQAELEAWQAAGAVVAVVRSVSDVKAVIQEN